MENLIKIVAEKSGITETKAQIAVNAVVSFLKEKLPAGIGSQIDSFVKSGNGASEKITGSLKEKIGDFFSKK